MQKNEVKFWTSTLMASKPGGGLQVAHQWSRPDFRQVAQGINIYACDLATGWCGAGVISPENFTLANASLSQSEHERNAIKLSAPAELMGAAELGASPQEEITRRALTLCMFFLAQSHLYSTVRAHMKEVNGHWLALLYRYQSGFSELRPFYRSEVIGKDLLPPAALAKWSSEAVEADAGASQSQLHLRLQRGDSLIRGEFPERKI